MNALVKPIDSTDHRSQTLSADLSLLEARKRGLQRTLQALFREDLLLKDHLIMEGSVAWLPLWSQQAMLRIESLHLGRIGDCQLLGAISYYRSGARPQPVPTASALLACVAPSLPGQTPPDDLQRLVRELDNSTANDLLCLNYRRTWAGQLIAGLRPEHEHFIAALRQARHDNPALLLEQWGSLGHPWHPTYKTKLGLSAEEVIAFSPEFQPALNLPLAAIRSGKAYVAFAEVDDDYRAWFAQTFPECGRNWEAALHAMNRNVAEWLPMPLHPYQAQRLIPQKFASDIAANDLLLLPNVTLDATPTMSFRTVVPSGSPVLPHLKLPVSLRLTSVQRTVSPKSAVMGPRLTRLLAMIVNHENGFGGTLDIVRENVGLHYIDPNGDDDRARHLSILYRSNPMAKCTGTHFPIPVGVLFADSPFSGRPLVTDLVALTHGDHAKGAVEFFECYATTVLTAVLSAYLLYGIAFEAHQQNSFIMVNEHYEPAQLLVRDFGDLRVHGPTLRRTGLDLVPYRTGHTVYEHDEPVRDKLLHAVMLCHLAELALLLSRTYNRPEGHFWNVMRREVENAFDRLRARADMQRWNTERRALLEDDWPAKSFLRMRLTDTSDDVHGSIPNPLQAMTSR
jgi:siderophore synthetase component